MSLDFINMIVRRVWGVAVKIFCLDPFSEHPNVHLEVDLEVWTSSDHTWVMSYQPILGSSDMFSLDPLTQENIPSYQDIWKTSFIKLATCLPEIFIMPNICKVFPINADSLEKSTLF